MCWPSTSDAVNDDDDDYDGLQFRRRRRCGRLSGCAGPLIVELLFDTFGASIERAKVNGDSEVNCNNNSSGSKVCKVNPIVGPKGERSIQLMSKSLGLPKPPVIHLQFKWSWDAVKAS